MYCFNCGNKLISKSAESCVFCGVRFKKWCSLCNTPLPQYANFCPNCGTYIKSPQEQQSNVDSLKKVAVIFADISGFTRLSEKYNPEEINNLINEFFEYILKPVYALEGTIDKFIGDCVMILFGARISHIDDPKRAVLCGVEMLRLCNEFSVQKGIQLSISIGINYGLVAVGKIGGYYEKDYTVIGDVVNVAQRLQMAAPENTIYVSETIFKETLDSIHYSEPIELFVKNKTAPIKCYIPLSVINQAEPNYIFMQSQEKCVSQIFNMIAEKKTNGVIVLGKNGMGKTLILEKIFHDLQTSNVRTFYIKCSSAYHSPRPYFTITCILAKIFNFEIEDDENYKKHRLLSFLDYLFKDDNATKIDCFNFISLIFQLDIDENFKNILLDLTPEDIQFEINRQIYTFFDRFLDLNFSVFIIDDINLADSESIKLINSLLSKLPPDKTFFVFSSSYEIDELKINAKLTLQKPAINEISHFVKDFFNVKEVTKEVCELIYNISEGKIIYIQEVVKYLKLNQIIEISSAEELTLKNENFNISEIRQKIFAMKLANLSTETIEFVKLAAVYGKQFNARIIVSILNPSISETDLLFYLLKSEIIKLSHITYQANFYEKIYEFTSDDLYKFILESIPQKTKSSLHLKIAKTIEKLFNNNLAPYYETLIYHYMHSRAFVEAAEYSYLLALTYKKQFLYQHSISYLNLTIEMLQNLSDKDSLLPEALNEIAILNKQIGNYSEAIEFFKKLKTISPSEKRAHLLCEICECYIKSSQFKNAEDVLKELEQMIDNKNNLYPKLIYLKSTLKSYSADPELLKIIEEAEKILKSAHELEYLINLFNIVAFSLYNYQGEDKKAISYLNKALRLAKKIKNIPLTIQTSGNLGTLYYQTGNLSLAIEYLNQALNNSKKILNRHTQINLSINLGIIYFEKGLFKSANDYLSKAYQDSKSLGFLYEECLSLINIAELNIEKGILLESYNLFNLALSLCEANNFKTEAILCLIGMSKIFIINKNFAAALENLIKAYEFLEEANEISIIFEYHLVQSELKNCEFKFKEALFEAEKALQYALKSKSITNQLRAYRQIGKILALLERTNEAIENVQKSIRLAQLIESYIELAKSYHQLSLIYKTLEDDESYITNLNHAKYWANKIDEDCYIKNYLKEV